MSGMMLAEIADSTMGVSGCKISLSIEEHQRTEK